MKWENIAHKSEWNMRSERSKSEEITFKINKFWNTQTPNKIWMKFQFHYQKVLHCGPVSIADKVIAAHTVEIRSRYAICTRDFRVLRECFDPIARTSESTNVCLLICMSKKNIHNIHELEQHRIFFSFFFLRRCVMLARSRLELSIYSRELWANVTRQKKIPHPQAGRDIQVKQLNYRRKEISSSRPGVECIRDCMEVLLDGSSDLAYIFLLFHTKTWDIFPHLITLLRSTLGEAHSDFSTSTYDNDEFSWSEIKPSLWVFIHTWEFL